MGTYTWEQIWFFVTTGIAQAIQLDDENEIAGDAGPDEKIKIALKRWDIPYNRIVDENNLKVYRIECRSESCRH